MFSTFYFFLYRPIAFHVTCEEDDGADGNDDDNGGGIVPGQDGDGRGRILHAHDDTCQCHRPP